MPQCSYLICATPRSGSTLLCEALTNTGLAGRPEEYFEALKESGRPRRPKEYFLEVEDPEIDALLGEYAQVDEGSTVLEGFANYREYLAEVIKKGTTPNGVFGAKVMWGYLDDFVSYLRTIPQYRTQEVPELLATVFPNLRYIAMMRRDKVRQAVSLWKAIQTQTWREEEDAEGNQHSRTLTFHFEAIEHLRQQLEEHEEAWQCYFAANGIQPFTVVYEDLVAMYEETTLNILRYLNIAVPDQPIFATRRRMKRQADALSELWVRQYYEVEREKGIRREKAGD